MTIIVLILSAIVAVILWSIYHQLFHVTYFGTTAIMTELVACFVFGFFIVTRVIGFIVGIFS
jgi:hypothetical protein